MNIILEKEALTPTKGSSVQSVLHSLHLAVYNPLDFQSVGFMGLKGF